MVKHERPLPNPFETIDTARVTLDALYDQVQAQQRTINMLTDSVGLLMRAENIRLDRAAKKKEQDEKAEFKARFD